MGRVARWLELHAEATRLHEQLMPLLTDSLEQSQTSGHAGNTDDGNLLELLARWQQLVGEMDTANLGPQAQALREPIARLARMNQEIGQAPARSATWDRHRTAAAQTVGSKPSGVQEHLRPALNQPQAGDRQKGGPESLPFCCHPCGPHPARRAQRPQLM